MKERGLLETEFRLSITKQKAFRLGQQWRRIGVPRFNSHWQIPGSSIYQETAFYRSPENLFAFPQTNTGESFAKHNKSIAKGNINTRRHKFICKLKIYIIVATATAGEKHWEPLRSASLKLSNPFGRCIPTNFKRDLIYRVGPHSSSEWIKLLNTINEVSLSGAAATSFHGSCWSKTRRGALDGNFRPEM